MGSLDLRASVIARPASEVLGQPAESLGRSARRFLPGLPVRCWKALSSPGGYRNSAFMSSKSGIHVFESGIHDFKSGIHDFKSAIHLFESGIHGKILELD